jgi:NAD(P)-dependent dehydrogenase (short-subunit alcohol dehydrogenase family)
VKSIVITGGTDGIGAALARQRLAQGDTVTVIGRDEAKGAALAALGAAFLPADLSLVSENRRLVAELNARGDSIDALVLCARYFRSHRHETAEGHEASFALEYLSRHLLGRGLLSLLEQALRPVVLNVSGPGLPKPEIKWADPSLRTGYSGPAAQMQAGRANDLLGIGFPTANPNARTRYVLVNPGPVATSFAGEYDPETAAFVERMKRSAAPVGRAVGPLSGLIDTPPPDALSAWADGRRINPRTTPHDDDAAARLQRLTEDLLNR